MTHFPLRTMDTSLENVSQLKLRNRGVGKIHGHQDRSSVQVLIGGQGEEEEMKSGQERVEGGLRIGTV